MIMLGDTCNAVTNECLAIHEGIGTQEHQDTRILSRLYASINYAVNNPVDHLTNHHVNPPKEVLQNYSGNVQKGHQVNPFCFAILAPRTNLIMF